LKVAVSGKGGVGKTTVAGTLARLLGKDGLKILAIDADPNANLWSSVGISSEIAEEIVPITENDELVKERTDLDFGQFVGNYFKMNPRVDDLAEKFAIAGPDNVSLLVAGTVVEGGAGCMCRSGVLLKALIRHLVLGSDEEFVMDMEAGIEHLGRGTTTGMDALLVVVEPGRRSLDTLTRIKKLASDIGVGLVFLVGNKVSSDEDRDMIKEASEKQGVPLIGLVPLDESIKDADKKAIAPLDLDSDSPGMLEIKRIKDTLIEHTISG
jgi:CO dehydrogenase maturation factor